MRSFPIRQFNEHGVRRFADLLRERLEDATRNWLSCNDGERLSKSIDELVEDSSLTVGIGGGQTIEVRDFQTRRELTDYLCPRIEKLGIRAPYRSMGLWAWIAARWFDPLTPPEGGERFVGAVERFVVEDRRKSYRHLVYGPCTVHRANARNVDDAMFLLCGRPHQPGEIVGQFGAKLIYQRAPVVLSLAGYLFYDKRKNRILEGTTTRARRLNDLMEQFDRTFDLRSMSRGDIVDLLPSSEFGELLREAEARSCQ